MPYDDLIDDLTEAIWPHIERAVARHGRDATSEALVAIVGRVLALHRSPNEGGEAASQS